MVQEGAPLVPTESTPTPSPRDEANLRRTAACSVEVSGKQEEVRANEKNLDYWVDELVVFLLECYGGRAVSQALRWCWACSVIQGEGSTQLKGAFRCAPFSTMGFLSF